MKIIKIKYATLAAATLLTGASVPALVHALDAQAPSAVSAPTSATTKQTIVLQHAIPIYLVKFLKWDDPSHLPAGVTQIQALPSKNALAITATSAGLDKALKIIQSLDVEPRQVSIVSAFAHASDADLKASGIKFDQVPANDPSQTMYRFYGAGSRVAQFLQTLEKQEAAIRVPDIITTNNVTATMSVNEAPSGIALVQQLTVTPRINGDNSVTLALHPILSDGTKREFSATRTVRSGDTMVIVLLPTASQTAGRSTLFFVTPTIK